MLMAREWESQDPSRIRYAIERLRCGTIDFDELAVQLRREAERVLAAEELADSVIGTAPVRANGREIVVVTPNAPPTDANVRRARTRSVYLENFGNVKAALAALKKQGTPIGKSTLHDHLIRLDADEPGWRDGILLSSGSSGLPEYGGNTGIHQKRRGKKTR